LHASERIYVTENAGRAMISPPRMTSYNVGMLCRRPGVNRGDPRRLSCGLGRYREKGGQRASPRKKGRNFRSETRSCWQIVSIYIIRC
jgi:hypothetical protein